MADIRCPMCGKTNPAEADTCQYCQARLTQIITPASPLPAGEPPLFDSLFARPAEDDGDTDWLSSLRSDSSPAAEPAAPEPQQPEPKIASQKPPEASPKEENQEWLQRIRQIKMEEQTGPLVPNTNPNETPDWIKRIKDVPGGKETDYTTQDDIPSPFVPKTGSGSVITPVTSSEDDDQEWARKMAEWQTLPEEPFQIEPQAPAAGGASLDNPSWLEEPVSAASSSNPSWLDEPVESVSAAPEPAAPENESELPTWLQDMSSEQTAAQTDAAQESIPDWLKAAGAQNQPAAGEPARKDVSSPLPQTAGASFSSEAAPVQSQNEASSNWLNAQADNTPIPDWSIPAAFLGDDAGPAPVEINPLPSEKNSSWHAAFKEPEAVQPDVSSITPDTSESPLESEASLDWLNAQTDNTAPIADWSVPSAFLGDDAGQSAMEVSPLAPEQDNTWSEAIKNAPPGAKDVSSTAPSADQTAPESEATPDWLSAAMDNISPSDWSVPSAFLGEDAGQSAMEVSPLAPEEDNTWSEAVKNAPPGAKDVSSAAPSAAQTAPESEATPDWLSAAMDNDSPTDWTVPPAFLGEDAGAGAAEINPPASDKDYAWLDAFQDPEPARAENSVETDSGENEKYAAPTAKPAATTAPQPFSAKDLPDWLGESDFESLDMATPALPEEPLIEPAQAMPFKEDSLDWLSAQQEDTPVQAKGQGAAPAGADLQPAQLPGWLQAMRPVESNAMNPAAVAAMQEDDSRIEKAGPLAGLRATLPTDSQAVQYRKPPIYSNTLHITDKQNVHATLLESLVSDSGRSHVSGKKVRKPSPLPRLIIGVLMLVLVAAFLYLSGADVPSSAPATLPGSDATLFANSIEGLPQNANVVLAIDYQPGYDGELHTAAQALIQRLIEKRINIILVSTTPSGPAIGESMLLSQSDREIKAVDLGYLPGGITSLQQFVIDPRSAAPAGYRESANILYYVGLMDKLAINPVWQTDSMKNILSIKDNTAAIVVATDSIDVGRAWVEQVKPMVGSEPMLFIASAQAAPLLRPYLLSHQVAGMLTGLNDGLAYQSYLQQSNKGHPGIANAMNMGVAFTLLLVVIGAVMQFVTALLKQTRRKGKEVS